MRGFQETWIPWDQRFWSLYMFMLAVCPMELMQVILELVTILAVFCYNAYVIDNKEKTNEAIHCTQSQMPFVQPPRLDSQGLRLQVCSD